MPNEKDNFPEYTKNSRLLPIIQSLSELLVDNFDFFNENKIQDIINDTNNENNETE